MKVPEYNPYKIYPELTDKWLTKRGWYRCRCNKWALSNDPSGGISCWPDEWAIEHEMREDIFKQDIEDLKKERLEAKLSGLDDKTRANLVKRGLIDE